MRTSRGWTRLILVLALLSTAACGSGSGGPPGGATAVATGGATASGPIVSDAWVRPPMGTDRPAAGYLTITNPGTTADALVGASSPIATSVQIHETMADPSGMMAMSPVDRIDVEPGGTVKLEPGGYHLMLMGVTQMPAVGQTAELTLTFEKAGEVVVQAEVRAG
jgi:Uncharacterized protein conserved in bacteria